MISLGDESKGGGQFLGSDPGQRGGHVDLGLQKCDPSGAQDEPDEPTSAQRVHPQEAFPFGGVFLKKPSQVVGVSLEVLAKVDGEAVHGAG